MAYYLLSVLEKYLGFLIYFSIFHFLAWGTLISLSVIFNHYNFWKFRKELFEFKRKRIIKSRDLMLSELDWLVEGIQEKKSTRDLLLDSMSIYLKSFGSYKDIRDKLRNFWEVFLGKQSKSEKVDDQLVEGLYSKLLEQLDDLKNKTNKIAEGLLKQLEQQVDLN